MRNNQIHVLVKLVALLILTILVRHFNDYLLLITWLMIALALLYCRASNAFVMLKRMRWLLLTMLLVYALNTPGEYILSLAPSSWLLIPTFEGLQAGVSQCLRLIVVVSALAWLLASTTRERLIGGLYSLFKPLSYLKCSYFGLVHVRVDAERFAVRLWLTLHYVERDEQQRRQHKLKNQSFISYLIGQFDALNSDEISMNHATNNRLDNINVEVEPFKKLDYLALILILFTTLFYAIYFKG